MLRFRQQYSLTAIYCTLQQDHFHEKRLTYLVTAAIAFRTGHWRSDKRQEARDEKW